MPFGRYAGAVREVLARRSEMCSSISPFFMKQLKYHHQMHKPEPGKGLCTAAHFEHLGSDFFAFLRVFSRQDLDTPESSNPTVSNINVSAWLHIVGTLIFTEAGPQAIE